MYWLLSVLVVITCFCVTSFREKIFRASVSRLREELVRAQALAHEANALAVEMNKDTEFTVTLQIPTHNLTPNRKVTPLFALLSVTGFSETVMHCEMFVFKNERAY